MFDFDQLFDRKALRIAGLLPKAVAAQPKGGGAQSEPKQTLSKRHGSPRELD
jgi:hypothetical protein